MKARRTAYQMLLIGRRTLQWTYQFPGIGVLLLLSVGAASSADCPDPEAVLSLMYRSDPVLQAEREEYRSITEKPAWKVELGAGWTLSGTEYGGSGGPNAGLRVSVPLFDPSTGLEKAKARSALAKAEDSRSQALLAELEKLCDKTAELTALDETRRLYRDRLRWRQQRVDEGYDKPQSLWEDSEALVKTEQAWKKAKQLLQGQRERLARTYGGERWAELKRVLEH